MTGAGGTLTGQNIGRYKVIRLVGAGGMGEVYAAHDPELGRTVAIKRLHPADVNDSDRAQRLRNEAEIHGGLQHDAIVRLYDIISQDGADYIVSEYVEGRSLRDVIEQEGAAPPGAINILRAVVRALRFAHQLNIVHRDIKTENVLIGSDGTIKLTDFGLSRSLDPKPRRARQKTAAGVFVGSFHAMSPEQSRGETIDFATDIWALGTLAYELYTGDPPFEGATDEHFVANVQAKKQTPLRERAPNAAVMLSELVDRMLEKRRERRPNIDEISRVVEDLAASATGHDDDAIDKPELQHVAVVHATARLRGSRDAYRDLAAFHVKARRVAQRLGASVIYGAGDEVTFCLGYPRSFENNAEVATQVATELFFDDSGEQGRTLDVSAAIDVGNVHIVAGAAPRQALFLGRPVRRALAIGRNAPAGTFLASAEALDALERSHRLEPYGTTMSGTVCYEVIAPKDIELGGEDLEGPAFVGRTLDQESLTRDWASVCDSGAGRVVALEGEAGIGKSRLLHELIQRERGRGRTLLGRATAQTQFEPLAPLRMVVRQLAELQQDDRPARDRIVAHLTADDGTADNELIAVVAQLCGVTSAVDDAFLKRLEDQGGPEALAKKVAWFLASLAEDNPLLLIVEDLHWCDHSSLGALEHLIGHVSQVPIYMVVTYRPTFDTGWASNSGVTRMALGRLSEEDAVRLIHAIAGTELPENIVATIADRSEGVPLRLAELTRFVVDQIEQGKTAADVSNNIPASVRDAIQHRLQSAGPHVLRTAQVGAALGRAFNPAVLREISGRSTTEITADVDALVSRGIVQRRGFVKNRMFVFRHGLLREAIYNAMDLAGRTALHADIVRCIQDKFPNWESDKPEFLARHCESAGLPEQAADYWISAGKNAAAMHSHLEASEILQHVCDEVVPMVAPQKRDDVELAARDGLGLSLMRMGLGSREVEQNHARINVLNASRRTPTHALTSFGRWAIAFMHCNKGEMLAAIGEMDALLADRDSDPNSKNLLSYLLPVTRGVTHMHLGLWSQSRAELAEAREAQKPVLDFLLQLPEHSIITMPWNAAAYIALFTRGVEGMWALQHADEAAYEPGEQTHLTSLSMGMVQAAIAGDDRASIERALRVIEEGPAKNLDPGHIDFAKMCLALCRLRRDAAENAEGAKNVPARVASMWQHFMGWQTQQGGGEMVMSSIMQVAVIAEACVDIAAHEAFDSADREAAHEQARATVDWGMARLEDPDISDMHLYYRSELHRVRGRLAALDGDDGQMQKSFEDASDAIAALEQAAGEQPTLLADRLKATVAQLTRD